MKNFKMSSNSFLTRGLSLLKTMFFLLAFVSIYQTSYAQVVGPGDWSSLRLYGHAYNVNGFTDAEYDWIANHNYFFCTEKRNAYVVYGSPSSEYASQVAATEIKSRNPIAKPLFYWNSTITYSAVYQTSADAFAEHPEWVYINESNGKEYWDYENADFREWWVDVATDQINNYDHEGIFLDATGRVENSGWFPYYFDMLDQLPGYKIYNGFYTTNAGGLLGGLDLLEHADAVYIEAFFHYTCTTPDKGKQLLDRILQIPADKGFVASYQADSAWNSTDHKFGMACYLIGANDNSFFRYAVAGYTTDNLVLWHDDFGEYIGAPRGVATVDGYKYSRTFANATVNVDLENKTSSIVWGPTPGNEGTIHEIGLIQAEDYNDMSGVKTETTTDVGGGLNVGYIGAGDWFEYEVNVPSSGTYTLDYRLASLNGGGSVQFQVEGITKETTSIASTGDWQNWETLSTSVSLSSGVQTIRLYAAAGGWNINWFELALENGPTGNLALNGIASQSTTAYGGEASRAIDGNTNGSYSGGSVTHTEAITNSWWRVNLGSDYSIDEIKIFNRTNACCTERLSNFTVFVIDAAGNYNFTQTYTTTPNPSLTIDLGGVTGKVVRIRSNLADTPLSLAEVEIYGSSSGCATFSAIEAEDFSSMSGVVDEGAHVGYINNGDWAMYSNVDLTCAASIDVRTSSKTSGGNIEVRLGSPTGTLIGTVAAAGTGSWTTWATASASLSSVSGTNDVYLVFTGGNGYLFNLDWLEFSENTQSAKIKATKLGVDEISLDEDISDISIYPNPTSSMLTIKFTGAETADVSIFDITGRTVLSNTISSGSSSIDTSSLPTGLYMIRISTENKTYAKKLIKR